MKIFIPATSANLGPGFDSLGLALQLYNEVTLTPADADSIEIRGEGEGVAALHRDNAFVTIFQQTLSKLTGTAGHFRFEFLNRIPFSRGLGSSSSVVVGGVAAAFAVAGAAARARYIRERGWDECGEGFGAENGASFGEKNAPNSNLSGDFGENRGEINAKNGDKNGANDGANSNLTRHERENGDKNSAQNERENGEKIARESGKNGEKIACENGANCDKIARESGETARQTAANFAPNSPTVRRAVLNEALTHEHHPDNIAPAALGGFSASVVRGGRVFSQRCAIAASVRAVVAIPKKPVSTDESRKVLPAQIPLADAVANLSGAAFVAGCFFAGDYAALRRGDTDTIHQEARMRAVAGLGELRAAAYAAGAFYSVLSGSGSSFLSVFDAGLAERAAGELSAKFPQFEVVLLDFDNRGYFVEE